MNETQFSYNRCDKAINIKIKSKHFNSKTHKQKKEYGTVVKPYEFIKTETDEVNYILKEISKECKNKYFHAFEVRCVYSIKLLNMESNGEVILTIIRRVYEI